VLRRYLIFLAIIAFPLHAVSEHANAEDEDLFRFDGVKVEKPKDAFPDSWISVGGSVLGAALLERLRVAFPQHYREVQDPEGFLDASICAHTDSGYVIIKRGDFGPALVLRKKAPARITCAEAGSSWDRQLTLDSGLQLGQRREDVAKRLGVELPQDKTSFISSFDVGTESRQNFACVVSLSLEFVDDSLVRIDLRNLRERY